MAASDYVPISFKNRLHLAGRPQMGSRPSQGGILGRLSPIEFSTSRTSAAASSGETPTAYIWIRPGVM